MSGLVILEPRRHKQHKRYKNIAELRADLKHKGAIMTLSSQIWFHNLLLPSGPLYGDFLFGRYHEWKIGTLD